MGTNLIWWKDDPEKLSEFMHDLQQYPKLKVQYVGDSIWIQGQWDVFGKTEFIRSYSIRICIPDNFPKDVPLVYEIGDEIHPKTDRHFNPGDHTACLFAQPERWLKWPPPGKLSVFLNGPVKEFFFSQAFFELTGEWPFGDRSHGNPGILEFYLEKLELRSKEELGKLIQYLGYNQPYRQWKCACGSGKRVKACHWEKLKNLEEQIPATEWEHLKGIFRAPAQKPPNRKKRRR